MRLALSILLLCAASANAATYYVGKDGDDTTGDGSSGNKWKTIQKALNLVAAGDTVLIGGGDYNELVETVGSGTSVSPIRITTNPTNGTPVFLRQIRVEDPFYVFSGLRVNKSIETNQSDQNEAHIRVEPAAQGTIITNCAVTDTPLLSARFHFVNSGNDLLMTITNSSAGLNFWTNGFITGGLVFLGASSVSNAAETPVLKYYVNHDNKAQIKSISADGQTLTITNFGGTNWLTETEQSKWATIYAGKGSAGYDGILLALGTGVFGPTNCLIINNTLSNMSGSAFKVWGESNQITGNVVTRLNAHYAMRPFGRHNIWRRNTFRNSPNRLWLSDYEYATATHPAGSEFFDYNVGALHSQDSYTTNILIEQNWFEDIDQQLGIIDKRDRVGVGGYTLRSNVFVGIQSQMSQNADWITNRNNTFHKVSFESGHALTAGGPSASILQTNIDISYNAFIACGEEHDASTGWYSSSDTYGSNFVGNFVAGPEGMGWPAKTSIPSRPIDYNGGDPGFVNVLNPIGADGLAFTDDDGLKPLPNSPLAINGVGALTPVSVVVGTPIAHFSKFNSSSWADYTYTNWNTAWHTVEGPERGGWPRPYTTPDPLGNVPVTVVFSATNSIDGVSGSTTNSTIRSYGWDFGDGARMLTTYPGATHTFCLTGTHLVTLSVTNLTGGWAQSSNLYRVLPFTNYSGRVYYISTAGNDTTGTGTNQNLPWRTIDKGADNVTSNGVVVVLPGDFEEVVDITQNSAADKRTRFISYGATNGAFNVRKSYYTFDGFDLDSTNLTAFLGAFYLYEDADAVHMVNNYIHDKTNTMALMMALPAATDPAAGQQSCIFSNNIVRNMDYVQITLHGANHVVTRNELLDSGGEGDAFRPWGSGHLISLNLVSNMNNGGGGGHSDLFQVFGTDGYHAKNHIIERNTFIGTTNFGGVALCQFEQDPSGGYDYTNATSMSNWVYRNNLFIRMTGGGSIDMDGQKFYNNLFSGFTNGHAFALGGTKGSAYGFEAKNNIFYQNGYTTNQGWYPAIGSVTDGNPITNYTLNCNFNFIVHSNGLLVATYPTVNNGWGDDSQEANSINGGDPLFVDAAIPTHDYRLLDGSPLLGAGTDLSSIFTDDFGGATRTIWSIGPYEFSTEGAPESPAAVPRVTIRGRVNLNGGVTLR